MTLLSTGMFICYAQRGVLAVAAPFLMSDLHLSPAAMGVLLSAFSWSYALLNPPAGWMVDRIGVKRAYGLGYVIWSVASALIGFAGSFVPLVLLRLLLGVGQSVAFPASARAVANWFPDKERGAVTASYLMGVRLGQAFINALGAIYITAYGWQIFCLATGALPVIWIVPWFVFLGRWERGTSNLAITGTGPKKPSLFQSLALLKQRSVLGIFLGYFAQLYSWNLFISWLPAYLVTELKFTPREMGFYSSVPYVAMSVAILLSGISSDWLIRLGFSAIRVRKAFIAVGMATACLIVPAAMAASRITAVWLLGASLCGLGISVPNIWTLTQAICSKNIVGSACGIQNFGGNLGGIVAPALTGYIVQTTGSFSLALGIAGALLLGGILSFYLLVSRRVEMA